MKDGTCEAMLKAMEEYADNKLQFLQDQHNKELKEIREILQVNLDHYNIPQNREYVKGIKDSIKIIDKHIKN